jgi:hypothetical protein
MSHLKFPSQAVKASKEWSQLEESVDVPSLVLMENMGRDGAEVVFVAFRDLSAIVHSDDHVRVISKVLLVTMKTEHVPLLPEPVRVSFVRTDNTTTHAPLCVRWDDLSHGWTESGCRLLDANATHGHCACAHFGMMALATRHSEQDQAGGNMHITTVVAIVVVAMIVFCGLVSVGVGLEYCRKVQGRHQWRRRLHSSASALPCFQKYSATIDSPARNIYVSHHSSYTASPVSNHYSEVGPEL